MSTANLSQPTTTQRRSLGDELAERFRAELRRRVDCWEPIDRRRCVMEHWTPRGDGRALVYSLDGFGGRVALVGPGSHVSTVIGGASTEGWRLTFWRTGAVTEPLRGCATAVESVELNDAVALSALGGPAGDRWLLDCLDESVAVLGHYADSNPEAERLVARYAVIAEKVRTRTEVRDAPVVAVGSGRSWFTQSRRR